MASSRLTVVLRLLAVVFMPSIHASAVASLNRVTFAGNVFGSREGEGNEGWMVLFCVDWYEPCKNFQDAFLSTAAEHGGMSDDEVLSRTTRFAQVDCAVDKVLCNSQDVGAYPTVVHYRLGGRAGEWSQSGRTPEKEAKSFQKWVAKQMQHMDTLDRDVTAEQSSSTENDPITKFSMGMSAGQALPLMVFAAAGTMWVTRFGVELWEFVHFLREPSDKCNVVAPVVDSPAAEETTEDRPAVARCVPEGWAGGRCIEL